MRDSILGESYELRARFLRSFMDSSQDLVNHYAKTQKDLRKIMVIYAVSMLALMLVLGGPRQPVVFIISQGLLVLMLGGIYTMVSIFKKHHQDRYNKLEEEYIVYLPSINSKEQEG